MTETAEQQTSSTAEQVRQRAAEAAGTAGDQAASGARAFGDRVAEEARDQERSATGAVRQWADDLATMADRAPEDSPVRGLVARAADSGHRAADYLDENGVEGLAGELRDFAARRPAMFLGGVALAGFAAGRLARAGRAGPATSGGTAADQRS
ncbi:hypothetical protein [Streptomyces sp. NPDC049881]|uniref:hypothetical protein n=1 Tax=unclassified Streptomyces TaxID=2593676 RepID=UPI00341FDCC8